MSFSFLQPDRRFRPAGWIDPYFFRNLPRSYFIPPVIPEQRQFSEFSPQNSLARLGISCDQWNSYDMNTKRYLLRDWGLDTQLGGLWSIGAQIESMDQYCYMARRNLRAIGASIGGFFR